MALGVGLAMLVRAVAAPFPAYQIGDVAEADIVTPRLWCSRAVTLHHGSASAV